MRKIFIYINRRIVSCFFYLIFLFGSTIFFGALQHYLMLKEYVFLGGLCFPVLAVLFGFAALLYNRSRALPSGPAQRRSLYAAERALQATIIFVLGVGSAAIVATLTTYLGLDISNTHQSPKLLLIFFIPIMLVLFSFGAFHLALRAISHGMVRSVTMRTFLVKIREKKRVRQN